MVAAAALKQYFNAFCVISNFKNYDTKTKALAIVSIISYFTLVIPLAVAAICGAGSLCGRVSPQDHLSSEDQKVVDRAKKSIVKNEPSNEYKLDIPNLVKKAKDFAQEHDRDTALDLFNKISTILNNPSFLKDPYGHCYRLKRYGEQTEARRLIVQFLETEV